MIDADEKIEENNVEDNLVVPSSSSRAGSRRYMFDRHFFDMAEKVPEEEEIGLSSSDLVLPRKSHHLDGSGG